MRAVPEDVEQAVRRVVADLGPKLQHAGAQLTWARYQLGKAVAALDSAHKSRAVTKLAKQLGPRYGVDNLNIYKRIFETWSTDEEFQTLVDGGLEISDLRELAKVQDKDARQRLQESAITNRWTTKQIRMRVQMEGDPTSREKEPRLATPATPQHPDTDIASVIQQTLETSRSRKDEADRFRDLVDVGDGTGFEDEIESAIAALDAEEVAVRGLRDALKSKQDAAKAAA